MKFKRYNKFKQILRRHYDIQMNYYIDEIKQLENYSNTLQEDITTLLMIIEHYERIMNDFGVEFESLSYIFRKPEEK